MAPAKGKRLEKRFGRKGAPALLWAYAALAVGESAVRTIIAGPSALFLGFLAVGILLVWLLLRGGRAVWCFAVLSEVVVVVGLAWGNPAWSAGLSLLALALLCAPASRAYVWRESMLRRQGEPAGGLVARLSSGVLGEQMWRWIGAKVLRWAFIGWLALFWVLTLVVLGVIGSAETGSSHDGLVLDVLSGVIRTLHVLALLAMVFLPIVIGIRALVRRIQPRT